MGRSVTQSGGGSGGGQVGDIIDVHAEFSDAKFVDCDGSAILRASYPDLSASISTTGVYGVSSNAPFPGGYPVSIPELPNGRIIALYGASYPATVWQSSFSTDGGATWSTPIDISTSYTAAYSSDVVVFVEGNTVYTGLANNTNTQIVWFSTTDGVTWTYVGAGTLPYRLYRMLVGTVLKVGARYLIPQPSSYGVMYSSTLTGTWTTQNTITYGERLTQAPDGSVIDWGSTGTTGRSLAYRTTDGLNWTQITSLPAALDARAASNGADMLVGDGSTGDVYKSTDNGVTWTQAVTGASLGLSAGTAMLWDAVNTQWLYYATTIPVNGSSSYTILTSTDGISWTGGAPVAPITSLGTGLITSSGYLFYYGGVAVRLLDNSVELKTAKLTPIEAGSKKVMRVAQ